MATLNQVQLSGSTLTSKIVHKSKLIKCTVIRVTIHNPSISDSVLTNCSIYDCVIHTSKIYNCKIYGDKPLLRCEFEGYELLPSQPTLSKLPVEIREKIFKLCLTRVWNAGCRKTPALLVALRVRTELYFEALEVFNKNNFFCLKNGAKLKLFKAMPQTVLSNIRWMAIHIASFPEGARDCSTCFRTCEKMIKLFLFTTRLPIGHTNTTQEGHSVCHWIDVVVPQCPSLRALKFSAVLTSHLTPGQPVSEMNKFPQPLTFTTALEEVNYRLGFDDTKTPIEEHRHGLEAEWEWIADKGKTLTWRKR